MTAARSFTRGNLSAVGKEAGSVVFAMTLALLAAYLVILATSKDPTKAVNTLICGPLSSKRTIGLWIDDVAKLTMAGLAFSLVFQARQFALGVQGQIFVGGLFAALVAMSPLGSTWIAVPLGILAASLAGAIYGFVPGFAKVRFGANEIVSSLMLNYLAILFVHYMVRVELTVPGSGELMSSSFPAAAVYPVLIVGTRVDLGSIISIVTVAIVWFALYRTSWGLKLRLVGHNPRFAEQAGIRANVIMISAMTASGAIGGLLGANFILGKAFGRIEVDFDGKLAFEGILIAIVGRNRPLALPIVALFYGYLRQGAQLMGIRTDVPTEINSVVQAIIILLVASSFTLPGLKLLGRLLANYARHVMRVPTDPNDGSAA